MDHHSEPQALPADWVAVHHVSGATVYLHQPTRVVTFSRPYQVPTSKTIRVHTGFVPQLLEGQTLNIKCFTFAFFAVKNVLQQRCYFTPSFPSPHNLVPPKKHGVCVQSIPCLEQWLFAEGQRSELALAWHRQQGEGGPRNCSLVKIGIHRNLRKLISHLWKVSLQLLF